jgi:hypothetical protein
VPYSYTFAAALALVFVCLFAHKLRAGAYHRRRISIAAGVSVATIFVDILPQVSENQARFSANGHLAAALFPEQAVYLAALFGFVLFFGIQYMSVAVPAEKEKPGAVFYGLQIAAFATYYSLISYLMVHSIWKGVPALLIYAFAMAFHLLLVDYSLAEKRPQLYATRGRWVLAIAVIAGWSIGVVTSIPDQWLARITGFVAGGVIMNSLVVELPEGRGGRFWFFASSAAIYALVLIFVLK